MLREVGKVRGIFEVPVFWEEVTAGTDWVGREKAAGELIGPFRLGLNGFCGIIAGETGIPLT